MASGTHLYQGEYAPSLLAELRAEGKAIAQAKGLPEWSAEHFAQGYVQGCTKGLTTVLLLCLDNRGLASPDQASEHVRTCADISTLATWIGRAAVSDTLDEVFA
ncbi:hypothetical protein ACBI99_34360 [Nonomuraea sp. ATR24]|uniref:hypothetical protein n=1 Tax=Nonomuraea sp. ATR24 TaxID=1676744 RepID=UPI0035BF0042